MRARLRVLVGDVLSTLPTIPAGSVNCCVTSPPYFGLRDYGVAGQIGLEPTPSEYVSKMVAVFREVKRVLRDDGTVWLNIGDSYANDSKWGGSSSGKHVQALHGNTGIGRGRHATGLKAKDLIGIPWRVAFALQADGWYLRQDIIWHKPNPMPESVMDRCTKAHEYIFLLSKSERYYFDSEAMREPCSAGMQRRAAKGHTRGPGGKTDASRGDADTLRGEHAKVIDVSGGRNRRSVWTVSTKPYKGAHFATYPPDLIEPCVLAGTSGKGHCPDCGKQWVKKSGRNCLRCGEIIPTQGKSCPKCAHVNDWKAGRDANPAVLATDWSTPGNGTPRLPGGFSNQTHSLGWFPGCVCGTSPVPDVVLDPFGGSGTTAGVAMKHGRRAILCELNPEYAAMVPARVESIRPKGAA